jgi:hypothetical protein
MAISRSGFSVGDPPPATKPRILTNARTSTALSRTVAPPEEPASGRTSMNRAWHETIRTCRDLIAAVGTGLQATGHSDGLLETPCPVRPGTRNGQRCGLSSDILRSPLPAPALSRVLAGRLWPLRALPRDSSCCCRDPDGPLTPLTRCMHAPLRRGQDRSHPQRALWRRGFTMRAQLVTRVVACSARNLLRCAVTAG